MGGVIKVESELDLGSTFTFTLPVLAVAQQTSAVDLGPQVKPGYDLASPENLFIGQILLAEDHMDNRRLITRWLTKLGLEVIGAANGAEVIELYEKHQLQVILVDIPMPEIDGVQAYKILRERGCTLPIIALTANAMSHEP